MSSLQNLKGRLAKLKLLEEPQGNTSEFTGTGQFTAEHLDSAPHNFTSSSTCNTGNLTGENGTTLMHQIQPALKERLEEIERSNGVAAEWLHALQQLAENIKGADKYQRLIVLFHFYGKAIKGVPKEDEKSEAFGHLLVHYAQLRGELSESDGRSAFSSARVTGHRFPFVHVAAAHFELDHGNKEKARRILLRAKDRGVQPTEQIDLAFSKLIVSSSGSSENSENLMPTDSRLTSSSNTRELSSVFYDHSTPLLPKNRGEAKALDSAGDVSGETVRKPLCVSQQSNNCMSAQRTSSSGSSQSEESDSQKFRLVNLSRGGKRGPQRVPMGEIEGERLTQEEPAGSAESKGRHLRWWSSTPDCKGPSLLSSASCSSKQRRLMPRAMRVPIKLQELDEPMEEDQASPSGMNIKTPPLETQGSVENDASTTAKGLSEGTETKKPSEPVMEAEKVAKQKVPSPQTSAPFLPPCIPGKQTNATAEPRNNSSAASIPCVQPQISSVPQKHIQPQHLQQPTQQQLQSAPSALISSFLQKMDILTVNEKQYLGLRVIGRGGSSKVYSALGSDQHEYAIKCVDLTQADELTAQSYVNEIHLLKRLQYSQRIIKMYDFEYNASEGMLYVVMEKGAMDLMTELRLSRKIGDLRFFTIKPLWHQMLLAVQVLHKEGIVHSDLKPANFVRCGCLKLIDFGIANAIQQDRTSVTREQQIGSLNYMSPEAIIDVGGGFAEVDDVGRAKPRFKIGVKSDVWSLGCILYNMVYNCTPFQKVANVLKLQAIINPSFKIEFPPVDDPHLMDTMQRCLQRDPKLRPSIEELLNHPYLN